MGLARLFARDGHDVALVARRRPELETLAAALTGGSPAVLEASTDRVVRWLEERFPEGVRITRTLASFEDLDGMDGLG